MSRFRTLQRQLESIVTKETLKAIQDEVDTNVGYVFIVFLLNAGVIVIYSLCVDAAGDERTVIWIVMIILYR
jgi:hypothetical protein